MNKSFDYEQFIRLDGLALAEYVEPFLRDHTVAIAEDVFHRFLSDLPWFDSYHLVYALELGASRSPQLFIAHIPQYLAHKDGAVCCTALNILDRLPDDQVTVELVESVRFTLASHPVMAFVLGIRERLERRLEGLRGRL